jgi:glucose-1-phosphate adenylyltransferase
MARERVLAIVQAGGSGSRMDVLTRERAKPSLPFAGIYQLVDFPMSNLRHSRIEDVWLSVQYQANSLDEDVASGRPWDLDRDTGGFRLLMPQQGGSPDAEGFAAGNAHELFQIRDQIRAFDPSLILVASSDHVYRFDFRDAIQTHLQKKAECTVVTTEVARDEAAHHATVQANRLARVTSFAYKPSRPATGTVAAEIFVYDPTALLDALDELHRELTSTATPDSAGLGDFGDHLIPHLVDRGRTFVHPMPGYWRDLGRPETYVAAHRDLLRGDPGLFDDRRWPIMTRLPQRAPARVCAGARIEDSLVSPSCVLEGTVRRSVLGPGVVVGRGATVTDSVIFADVHIGERAAVSWSVLDREVAVEAGARVGGSTGSRRAGSAGEHQLDGDRLTLVGRSCRIGSDSRVPGGARLEPGTTT